MEVQVFLKEYNDGEFASEVGKFGVIGKRLSQFTKDDFCKNASDPANGAALFNAIQELKKEQSKI